MVLVAALVAAGCTGRKATAAGPTVEASAVDVAVPPERTFDWAHLQNGPDRVEIGRWYPFDLLVHCTGEYTGFGGYTWRTDTPPGDVRPTPDANGISTYTGYLPGWMEQTGSQTARFAGGGRVITYVRVAGPGPLCA
jgi:hypothetical protein